MVCDILPYLHFRPNRRNPINKLCCQQKRYLGGLDLHVRTFFACITWTTSFKAFFTITKILVILLTIVEAGKLLTTTSFPLCLALNNQLTLTPFTLFTSVSLSLSLKYRPLEIGSRLMYHAISVSIIYYYDRSCRTLRFVWANSENTSSCFIFGAHRRSSNPPPSVIIFLKLLFVTMF